MAQVDKFYPLDRIYPLFEQPGPDLFKIGPLVFWNYRIVPFASDGQDENGLQLGQFLSSSSLVFRKYR